MSAVTTSPPDTMPRSLWSVFSRLPAGVTVAATLVDGLPVGMVVSSFQYVSMDPPLVGFFGDVRSSTLPALLSGDGWGFSVLAEGDDATADAFRRPVAQRFEGLPFTVNDAGAVLLDRAVFRFATRRHDVADAGDHQLVLARVEAVGVEERARRPMVYFDGRLTRLDPAPLTDRDHWDRTWDL